MILLDTDTCIRLLRGVRSVLQCRRETDEEVAVCFMTVGELFYGAEKSADPERNRLLVAQFLLSVRILQSGTDIMRRFGIIKATLQKKGKSLTDADLMIGATALSYDARLVTGNTRHYDCIDGIRLENWLR